MKKYRATKTGKGHKQRPINPVLPLFKVHVTTRRDFYTHLKTDYYPHKTWVLRLRENETERESHETERDTINHRCVEEEQHTWLCLWPCLSCSGTSGGWDWDSTRLMPLDFCPCPPMWLPVRKAKETSSFLESVIELQKWIKTDSFARSKQYHH